MRVRAGQVVQILAKHMPPIVILENVPPLLQEVEGADSDASYVTQSLKDLGYSVTMEIIEADAYGSPIPRKRLYWMAVKTDASTHGERGALSGGMLRAMRCVPMDIRRFVFHDHQELQLIAEGLGCKPVEPPSKMPKQEPSYKTDHMAIFPLVGLKWPPDVSSPGNVMSEVAGSLRVKELLFFCDYQWPFGTYRDKKTEEGTNANPFDFIDANFTLPRLVKISKDEKGEVTLPNDVSKLVCPWFRTPLTLTCHTLWYMRYKTEGRVAIRLLQGFELLSLIGWCPEQWVPSGGKCMVGYGQRLSGNAFSGFAVGPAMLAAIASWATGNKVAQLHDSAEAADGDDSSGVGC